VPRLAIWAVSIALVLVLGLIAAYYAITAALATAALPILALADDQLAAEKLRQEVIALALANHGAARLLGQLPPIATFVTALVAVVGVFVTVWRQMDESRRQREQDRRARRGERAAAEAERARRSDEAFARTIANLGSPSEAVRAAAIISLMSYVRPEYASLHDQVFLLLLANLKIDHTPVTRSLVTEAFERAARVQLASPSSRFARGLDLARAHLRRIDLSGLPLREADVAFAELRGADLSRADLFRVRGLQADLEGARLVGANLNEARLQRARLAGAELRAANLVAADLKHADLRGAALHDAKLQSSHLDHADLRGARFEQANLNDSYVRGAVADDAALRSITRALNWRRAHFDPATRSRLEDLSGGGA
jgi:uncharacterized protein YjbI with pentapeptide repeats